MTSVRTERFGALLLTLAACGAHASGGGAPKNRGLLPSDDLVMPREVEPVPSEVDLGYEFQALAELAASKGTVNSHKDRLVEFLKTSPVSSLPLPPDPMSEVSGVDFALSTPVGRAVGYEAMWDKLVKLPALATTREGGLALGDIPVSPSFGRALLELAPDVFEAQGPLKPHACKGLRRPLLLIALLKAKIKGPEAAAWGLDCKLFARWAAMIKTLEIAYETSYGSVALMSCGEPYFLAFKTFEGLEGLGTNRYSRITYASYAEKARISLAGAPTDFGAEVTYLRQYREGRGLPLGRATRACGK